MKFICFYFIFSFPILWAQVTPEMNKQGSFKAAYEAYSQGKYKATIEELKKIEDDLRSKNAAKNELGLVSYWKGVVYSRMQDFPMAIEAFDKSLGFNYSPIDLPYEYGQALYAAEKLSEARTQFAQSFKRKYKRGVSLYYLGFLSKELGEDKKAVTFFKTLEKLSQKESQEVLQPGLIQVGDIYLAQAENHPDAFRSVKEYVIPQYEKALSVDEDSELSEGIKQKIFDLQNKYELAIFQMRNGRPAPYPPYFLRLAQEISYDTNVTFAPLETTTASSDQKSLFSKTDFLGRYSFFYKKLISLSPELRMNRTHYFNRVQNVYRNDNYLIAPALRSAYEYQLFGKQASHLFDFDYAYSERDVNGEEKLRFNSRAHTFMLGERLNLWSRGETILRYRHRVFSSFTPTQDSKTNSFIWEQIVSMGQTVLIWYTGYDQTRNETNTYDTNALTMRADFIFPRWGDWFTPSVGMGITRTDPINDRTNRGIENLYSPSLRLTRTFLKSYRASLKYEYQKNDSKDEANFAFTKSLYGLEVEYLF